LKGEINRLKGEKGKPKSSSKTAEKEADKGERGNFKGWFGGLKLLSHQ